MPERTFTLIGADGKPYPSRARGAFGGHRSGRIYGRLDCPAALRAIARGGYAKQRVFFRDEDTAVAAGYRPCAVCLPQAYSVWKNCRPVRTGGRAAPSRSAAAPVEEPGSRSGARRPKSDSNHP